MNPTPSRRPVSVAEVAEWSDSYREFGLNLKDFLHTLASAGKSPRERAALFAAEPRLLVGRFEEGELCDAFLAALADYSCRRCGIPSPTWSLNQSLSLARPWFSPDNLGLRALVLRDTPSAFKDKNIFILPSALEVA